MVYGLDPTLQTSALGGGIDPTTGLTIGDTMAKNASTQAMQEQLVQEAVERNKQSKLKTQTEQAQFDAKTYLSEKGLMTKEQAMAQLKIVMVMEEKPEEEIGKVMQIAEDMLPESIHGQGLYQWWTTLQLPKFVPKAFTATLHDAQTKIDNHGQPLEEGREYFEDVQGVIHLGGMTESQQIVHDKLLHPPKAPPAPGNTPDDKIWQNKIVPACDSLRASSRSALGMATRALTLSKRGMGLLSMPIVTEQQMTEVTSELSTVVTGGVGTDTGAQMMSYHTIQSSVAAMLQKLTGAPEDALPVVLKQYLSSSFNRIIANSKDIVQDEFRFYRSAYPQVIAAHQQAFDAMEQNAMNPSTENSDKYLNTEPQAQPTSAIGKAGAAVGKVFSEGFGGKAPSRPDAPASAAPAVDSDGWGIVRHQ